MNNDEFLKKIETELNISKKSKHTIRNYINGNKELLNFLKKQPEEITAEDVKSYIKEKLTKHSQMSIILFLSAIKYSFSTILKKDITLEIKRPKKEKKTLSILTMEEVKNLLSALKNKKSRLMISLLYGTGLKVSELINLKNEDLDFNEKMGHIRQGRKDRIFSMPENLFNELKEQVEKQKNANKEYVFTGKNNKLSSRNIQKIVSKAAKKAGIGKPVHPHTLRHSYATHLLESGEDIKNIQKIMGHSNISTTRMYSHMSYTMSVG